MSLVGDILTTWRDPAGPVGRLLASPPREDRSLVMLIAACLLMYLARLPELARAAVIDPAISREARFGITFFVMMFMVPLLAYLLAGGSHLVMRALGRHGAASDARTALFWALLAVTPGVLMQGLAAGLAGSGSGVARGLGLAVFAAFVWFWVSGLRIAYPAGGQG
jgi:hypothetical protein